MRYSTSLLVCLLAMPFLACGVGEDAAADADRAEVDAATSETGDQGARDEATGSEPEGSFELALEGAVDLTVSGSEIDVGRYLPAPDWTEELRIDMHFPHGEDECALVLRLPVGDVPVGEEEGTHTPVPQIERGPETNTGADLVFCRLPLVDGGTTRNILGTGGTVEITRATESVVEGTLDVTGRAPVPGTVDFRDVRISGSFTVPRDS